jgi:nucleotide-binding universal stress UspA family protein
MDRFRNILFVADRPDPDSAAFLRAIALARQNAAALTVMDVVEPMVWSAANQARFGADLSQLLRDKRLAELVEMTRTTGVAAQEPHAAIATQVAIGTPFLEIIRGVIRNGYDLVIKSVEPRGGMLAGNLGPNDQHLVRKCPCPVWIDQPQRPPPYRGILAAIDPLEDLSLGLGRTVTDLAMSLADREGCDVHLLHAWHLPGEPMLRGGRASLPSTRLEALLTDQRDMHAAAFAEHLSHYDLTLDSPTVHFEKGDAAALIVETAAHLPVDLVVIGTVGRTGVPGLFIGNTAESVIQKADTSVLAVKPRGFRSPVTA